MPGSPKRIAVFAGAAATILNTQPLVTSNKARAKHGLSLLADSGGNPLRFDALRAQRLAAPVTLYVEQFSAHPLEADAAELYGPPDGYLDSGGVFHEQRTGPDDVPVYEITLRPEDGLYPLPYMARQADGRAWEGDCSQPLAPAAASRQPFFPSPAGLFEEIDRLGVNDAGTASSLSAKADFDFFRALPSGGYTKGLPEGKRGDAGTGDIEPEMMGTDFWPYRPYHLATVPALGTLARLTNTVRRALANGTYAGAIWLEGCPFLEETAYWLNLVADTTLPIAGNAAQRPHGAISADGDRNIVDAVDYILSNVWDDGAGSDDVGVVLVQDQQVFTSRDVQKADARPGGYVTTGGHGGIVAALSGGQFTLTFRPAKRHTHTSLVNWSQLPASVPGVRRQGDGIASVVVRTRDAEGDLLGGAIPKVTIAKHARYLADDEREGATELGRAEPEIVARIENNLRHSPLAGLVVEGAAPYGTTSPSMEAALELAMFSGMPVVRVGRGNAEGVTPKSRGLLGIAGSNLTATKARMLLTACLLRFGSLPPAKDARCPSPEERQAAVAALARYQEIFDSH